MTSATSIASPADEAIRRPRAVGFLVAAAAIVGMTYVSSVRPAAGPTAGLAQPSAAPAAALGASRLRRIPRAVSRARSRSSTGRSRSGRRTSPPSRATSCRRRPWPALYHARGRLTGDLADHQRALEAAQTAARRRAHRTGGATGHRGGGPLHAPRLQRGARRRRRAVSRPTHAARRARHDGRRQARARTRRRRTGGLCRARDARQPARRRHPTRPPGVRLRPAGRGAPPAHAPPAMRPWPQAAAGETVESASTSSRRASTHGWPAMPLARGRATRRPSTVRDTDLGALVGLARIDAFEGRTRRRHRRARAGGRDRPTARDPRAPRRPAGSDRRRRRGARASSRPCASSKRLGEIAEHRLRPRADPLRARPRRRHPTPCWPRRGRRSPRDPTPPATTPSPGRCIGSVDTTRRPPRSRAAAADGAADARLAFHRGAIALAGGDAARRSRRAPVARSRSDRRSTRSSEPRHSELLGQLAPADRGRPVTAGPALDTSRGGPDDARIVPAHLSSTNVHRDPASR